jgi:hypothetical protein
MRFQQDEPDDQSEKAVSTVIWGSDEFHLVDMMPSEVSFNTEYFLTLIMDPLLAKVFPERGESFACRLNVYLDNCRVHSSNACKTFLMKILWLLFFTRCTVLTWHDPISVSSVTSRHLLQIVH